MCSECKVLDEALASCKSTAACHHFFAGVPDAYCLLSEVWLSHDVRVGSKVGTRELWENDICFAECCKLFCLEGICRAHAYI